MVVSITTSILLLQIGRETERNIFKYLYVENAELPNHMPSVQMGQGI